MKIETSYELRGARIHQYMSIPHPTVENLTEVIKQLAWVAGRGVPEITVSEFTK